MTTSPIAFGLFDHLDRPVGPPGPVDLHAFFEERLRFVEAADRAGFRTYHVAEHHATPLGMAPMPGIYLAAVAQRTRRLRFGPLVYILPLYPPLRLVEEICMLDQLSGGRFELGVGRGISPYELAYYGVNYLEAREIYEEALEVILAGLRAGAESGRLTHRGVHYKFLGVPMELAPVQRPHPPLWQGIGSPDAAADAARRHVSVVTNAPCAAVRTIADAYWSAWPGRDGAEPPLVGMQRHVYIADTDEEAVETARPAYKAWYDSLVHLWRQFGSSPVRFADSLDRAIANEVAIVGSPATVREQVARQLEASGVRYLVGRFLFGTLTADQALRSLRLFSEEVMPSVAAAPAAQDARRA